MTCMGLKDLRKRRKLSQERVAEGVGISVPYLSRLETGDRNISGKLVRKFVAFFGCEPAELFTPDSTEGLVARPVQTVTVRGHVQAGEWQEALEWDASDHYSVTAPMLRTTARNAFGLEVRGTSMDRVYRAGDVLICVPIDEFHEELQSGKHVICERTAPDGQIEATVKELQIDANGTAWLWPRSTDPEHQQPIRIPLPLRDPQEADGEIRVTAVVVGSFTNR